MTGQIKALLCDLDGTLIDSEGLHLEAWNILLRDHGYAPPPHWNADCIGLPDQYALEKACCLFPDLQNIPGLLLRKQACLRDLMKETGEKLAYPGIADMLARFSDAGVKLAVGTNSILINTTVALEAAGLAPFFPVVVTLDQVENGKPHPDIYATAARRLGFEGTDCAVIEDSTAGLNAAKAAGCLALGVTTSWPAASLAVADRLFDDTPSAMAWTLSERVKHA